LPVTIANDANAAAVGELEFGMGRKMKNFVVLTLGTGLGSGIISDGKLLIGQHGMAGEIGHVNVNSSANARQCNCGLQGCLETYVSVTGMRRTIFELIAEMRNDSPLRSISFDEMTGEIISGAALQGDVIALKAFQQTAEILGVQMADTAAHLDPEAFILLGGLSKAGEILVKPTIESMEKHLFTAYEGKIKVLISDNPGDHAVLGPAALAWRRVLVK
jgi:glucokinase